MVTVLLVDDHAIVRDGLTHVLERAGGNKVIGHAATGEEAVLAARTLKPDVIIMDLMLPDMNGIDVMTLILNEIPDIEIIVLSAWHKPDHVYRALRAGACGYVVKSAAGAELVLAVDAARRGQQYVSPGIIDFTNGRIAKSPIPKSSYETLSERERQVLRRIAAGSSTSEIALQLSLSIKTVDTYRSRLMLKLGLRNRAALIRFAIENELLSP